MTVTGVLGVKYSVVTVLIVSENPERKRPLRIQEVDERIVLKWNITK